MQVSKLCIDKSGPNSVFVDFAPSTHELLNKHQTYGFALAKTLDHLGLEHEVIAGEFTQMQIRGSLETVKAHLPELQRHIGLIARYGAGIEGDRGRAYRRDWIGRLLGDLVQRWLPKLPEEASLMRTAGRIIWPFAEAINDDGVRIYYARPAPWRSEEAVVKAEDGTPLGPFSVRDIGGLLIGPDGLPAHEVLNANLQLPKADFHQLNLIGRVKGHGAGTELQLSLHRFLDKTDKAAIRPVLLKEDAQKILTNFRRVDLEAACKREFEGGATLHDLICTAVKEHLAESMADLEIRTKVEAEQKRLAQLYGKD